jgi:hypothetical protein
MRTNVSLSDDFQSGQPGYLASASPLVTFQAKNFLNSLK